MSCQITESDRKLIMDAEMAGRITRLDPVDPASLPTLPGRHRAMWSVSAETCGGGRRIYGLRPLDADDRDLVDA